MPTDSAKGFVPDQQAPPVSNEPGCPQPGHPVLDAASISVLRIFFELLDAWDQEENTDEQ
jgi:hypothetical protein